MASNRFKGFNLLTIALLGVFILMASPAVAGEFTEAARLGVPPIGTIKGRLGAASVDLTFNRRTWTIRGFIDGSAVNLSIDHDEATITGSVYGKPVGLAFNWSTERIVYGGALFGAPVAATLDWQKRVLAGRMAARPIYLRFALRDGWIRGTVGGQPTRLSHEPVSGLVSGIWVGRTLKLKLVNLDLSDFLQHTYLFLN